MEIKKAIITAAGFGSRFLPITKTFPKEMLPIIDKPIIHYLVQECADAGIGEIIIVVSPSEVSTFEDYFYGRATNIRTLMIRQEKLERWNKVEKIFDFPTITILPQDERIPYGNGRPVLTAKELVINEDAFVVMYGDDMVISKVSAVKQIVDYFKKNSAEGLLAVQEMPKAELSKYGIIRVKEGTKNEMAGVIEKPDPEIAPSKYASYGRYILTPKIFDYLTPETTGKDGEVWLQDANNELAQNHKVLFKVIDGEWYTTGDPLRYLKAHIQYALNDEKIGEDMKTFLKNLKLK